MRIFKRFFIYAVCLFAFGAILHTSGAIAQNGPAWAEVGVNFLTSGGVSSSPVSGFGQKNGLGFGIRVGKEVFMPGLNAYGGIDLGTQKLTLSGRNVGNIDRTSFVGGLRLNLGDDKVMKPYIGVGLNYTMSDGDSLGNGTLRMKDGGGLGYSADIGMRFMLKNSGWNTPIDFVNIGVTKNWGSTDTLETNAGAKVSDIKSSSTVFSIRVGKEF